MRQDDGRTIHSGRTALDADDSSEHEVEDFDVSDALRQHSADVTLDELLDVPSVLYEVFASQKRRAVIEYLVEHEDPASVEEVTTYVAAVKHETLPAAVTPGLRDEVRTRLVHIHFPKLAGFELITWDRGQGEISLQTNNGLLQVLDGAE